MILGKFLEPKGEYAWLIARLIFGILFLFHGLSKFGIPAGDPTTNPLFIVGGIIEIVTGIAVASGFLTRLAGVVAALQMAYAYLIIHVGLLKEEIGSFNPFENNGELALLFMTFFIVVAIYGSGKYGVEKAAIKKEIF